MSIHPAPVTERDLHGWADGSLTPERQAVVEAHLRAHPGDAAQVAAWQRQNAALRRLFVEPAASEGAGPALARRGRRLAARLQRGPGCRGTGWIGRALFGGAMLASGLAAGSYLALLPPVPEWEMLTRSGVAAHRSLLQPAATLEAPVAGAAAAPDLSAFGLRLAGWRHVADPLRRLRGTEYLYRDSQGSAVTLRVEPARPGREESFAFVQRADLAVFTWIDARATFTLVGAAHRPDLLKLADAVHEALVPGTGRRQPIRPVPQHL